MSFALLGLGWYIKNTPQDSQTRSSLLDLHMSFGLTTAIFTTIQIVLWIVFYKASFASEYPKWEKLLAYTLYRLIYLSLTLMLISGYLQTVFSGAPIQFWGTPMPVWGEVDVTLAGFFRTVHGVVAFVLLGSIFVQVCIGAPNLFKHGGTAVRTPLLGAQESRELALRETKSLISSKIAQRLAKKQRLFGWIGFWLQFVLAFVSGLLLAFTTSGHAFSPNPAGFGEPIYWGGYGFLLLCFAVVWAFFYVRAARKVVLRPDSYTNQKKGPLFGFLVQVCSSVFWEC